MMTEPSDGPSSCAQSSPDSFMTSSIVITSTGNAHDQCPHWVSETFPATTPLIQTPTPLRPVDLSHGSQPTKLCLKPSTSSTPNSDLTTTVELIEPLGNGALWDVYLARAKGLPTETVVVKITDLLKFPIRRKGQGSIAGDENDESESQVEGGGEDVAGGVVEDKSEDRRSNAEDVHGREDGGDRNGSDGNDEDEDEDDEDGEDEEEEDEDEEGYTRSEARRAIATEAFVYCNALKELQGKVVPTFYGVFGATQPRGRAEVCCMILEDAGRHLGLHQKFDKANQATVLEMYGRLHTSGILHEDVEWRHVRWRDHRLMLIDFERSTLKAAAPNEEEWEEACEEELDEVRTMIKGINDHCERQLRTWGKLMG